MGIPRALFPENNCQAWRDVVKIEGWIDLADADVPVNKCPLVATVGYTASGLYTVTLKDKYVHLIRANFTLMSASNLGQVVMVSETVATTKIIVLQVITSSTGADLVPANGDRIFIDCKATNSSLPVRV